jgi:hypothetical protein
VDRLQSAEDDPHRQYAQRGGQSGGSQTGLGDLHHGKLPSFAPHMNARTQLKFIPDMA